MELIKWSRNYSLGVEEIDSQHKHLVEVINKFISAKNVVIDSEKQPNHLFIILINTIF